MKVRVVTAIPSRMTIGQLYESLNGNWCAATGTHTDATIFKKVDIETMADELEKIGLNRYGYHRLYSGITGEFIDCMVFMGPTYYQRLQKFVIDTVYSVSQGPSDSLSRRTVASVVRRSIVELFNDMRFCRNHRFLSDYKIITSLYVKGYTFKLRENLVLFSIVAN